MHIRQTPLFPSRHWDEKINGYPWMAIKKYGNRKGGCYAQKKDNKKDKYQFGRSFLLEMVIKRKAVR